MSKPVVKPVWKYLNYLGLVLGSCVVLLGVASTMSLFGEGGVIGMGGPILVVVLAQSVILIIVGIWAVRKAWLNIKYKRIK